MMVGERRVAIDVLPPSGLSVEVATVMTSVVHGMDTVVGISVDVITDVGMV